MAQSTLKTKPLSNVAITGGTHGNELVGIRLVRHWKSNTSHVTRQSFKTHLALNNIPAIEKCVRYIDNDLNRCFSNKEVVATGNGYEVKIAHEIKEWIATNNIDFHVDLHNTTANTGALLILTPTAAQSMLNLQILAKLRCSFNFPIRVLSFAGKSLGGGILEIAGCGFGFENGPVPHGTLKADLFKQTSNVTCKVLDIIEEFNQGVQLDEQELEVYEFERVMFFPKDGNGNVTAMIHGHLEGKDWVPVQKGDPLFMTFSGETILHEGDEEIIPTFINEASYMEKDVAFIIVHNTTVKLQPVQKC